MSVFQKVPADTWKKIQVGAGIIVDEFDPETRVIGKQLGATEGGFSFDPKPTYEDFGSDIDNVPPNTWQLKRLQYYEPTLSGTFKTMDADMADDLNGPGGIDAENAAHIVPGHKLKESDFRDVWVIGDYSNANEVAQNAGFVAIHLMNALNVLGFRWQTNNQGKGQFAFEYHGHYDLENIDKVPFEIYVKAGVEEEDDGDTGDTGNGDGEDTTQEP